MNIEPVNQSHTLHPTFTSCNCYCQFIPPHIFHDLAILNGETFGSQLRLPSTRHGIMTLSSSSSSSSALTKVKKVDIQETHQAVRINRALTLRNPSMSLTASLVAQPSTSASPLKPKPATTVLANTSTDSFARSADTESSRRPTAATTVLATTPAFPVYDLDGATDLEDENGTPEYKKIIQNDAKLPGTPNDPSWPANAKRAALSAQKVYEFFKSEFGRNSINNAGMNIASCVRLRAAVITYDNNGQATLARDPNGNIIRIPENNAFWDGKVMAYGEGDNMIFNDFTASEDVIGHELTHGVTQFTCNLRYEGQSGALNEHISDVFGTAFRHKDKGMSDPATANWLIGDDCIDDDFKRMVQTRKFGYWDALRSMKDPGNAYAVIKGNSRGRDPQPAHMNNYLEVDYDNGGVHLNSGIPNKVFYLFSIAVGGPSWKIPGQVWYKTISEARFGEIERDPHTGIYDRVTTFQEFANASMVIVKRDFPQHEAKLLDAWKQVGVL